MSLTKIESLYFCAEEFGYCIRRMMVVVEGIPFYLSSGLNSGEHLIGTFLPFLGVGIQNENGSYGWLRKPGFIRELRHLDKTFEKDSSALAAASLNTNEIKRFATLKCLLISSVLSDALDKLFAVSPTALLNSSSFWHTQAGKKLKQYLKGKYAEFYKNHCYSLIYMGKTVDISSQGYGSLNWRKGLMQINGFLEERVGKSLGFYFVPEKFLRNLTELDISFEREPCPISYPLPNKVPDSLVRVTQLKKHFDASYLQGSSSLALALLEKGTAKVEDSQPEELIPYLAKNHECLSLKTKAKYILSLLKELEKIHQVADSLEKNPENSSSFLPLKGFHGAINSENVFYDSSSSRVYITGFQCLGYWPNVAHSSGYLPPEIAAILVEHPEASFLHSEDILQFKIEKGQATDLWSLALIFACLLAKPCRNEVDPEKNYFPPFYFLHNRLYGLDQPSRFYLEMSQLTQKEIDLEIEAILRCLPNSPEAKILSSLWSIVIAMLKVNPKERTQASLLVKGLESMIEADFFCSESVMFKRDQKKELKTLRFFLQVPKNTNQPEELASQVSLSMASPHLAP